MFKAIVALVMAGDECETFEVAFRNFYAGIQDMITKGTSVQVLETACFIQYEFVVREDTFNTAMGFDDCCDLARHIGLLSSDGRLRQRYANKTPTEDIRATFLRNTTMEIFGMLEMAENIDAVRTAASE